MLGGLERLRAAQERPRAAKSDPRVAKRAPRAAKSGPRVPQEQLRVAKFIDVSLGLSGFQKIDVFEQIKRTNTCREQLR